MINGPKLGPLRIRKNIGTERKPVDRPNSTSRPNFSLFDNGRPVILTCRPISVKWGATFQIETDVTVANSHDASLKRHLLWSAINSDAQKRCKVPKNLIFFFLRSATPLKRYNNAVSSVTPLWCCKFLKNVADSSSSLCSSHYLHHQKHIFRVFLVGSKSYKF